MTTEAKPKAPRVVWEQAIEPTGRRVRIVERERRDLQSGLLVMAYESEVSTCRNAMNEVQWRHRESSDVSETTAIIDALGSRCGCEGVKAEVPE